MIKFWEYLFMIIFSFSGGVAVGTAITSFLIVLDIIPRLAQITKSSNLSFQYEIILIMGIVIFTFSYLLPIKFLGGNILAIMFGAFMGIFIGLFAAALAEVLNVIPIMAKR